MDSQENIDTCLDCPIANGCEPGSAACPLRGKEPRIGRWKNKPRGDELRERDKRVQDMLSEGRTVREICESLGITKWMLRGAKQRLKEREAET